MTLTADLGTDQALRTTAGREHDRARPAHMMGMIDLSDLGITPSPSASAQSSAPPVDNGHLGTDEATGKRRGLVPGSALARCLFEVWNGTPVVLVDSPPGAGKTTLLVDLLEQIGTRSDLRVVLATPTRNGAADVAGRLAAALIAAEPDEKKRPEVVFGVNNMEVPDGCVKAGSGTATRQHINIRTIASCASSANPPECDVMIFDEAYQATFADVSTAADAAQQVVMVGDPGQIGPVVTVNTQMWDQMRDGPHRRAPEVFANRDDKTVLRLSSTYRLGQPTVDAIAPLYDFEFDSKRPDRHITSRDGAPLPELSHLMLDGDAAVADIASLRRIADKAASFVGLNVHETQPDGTVQITRMRESDVAIVSPHNNQQSTLAALLDSMGMEGITVGTADSLQGGQWHAVISIDPLFGHNALTDFQLAEGRLCVMASRHMTSMVWATVPDWDARLSAYAEESPTRVANGIAVRRGLTAGAPLAAAAQA